MKFLILLLFSFNLMANCTNYIPHTEAIKAVSGTNDVIKECSQLPSDECLCFDGIDLRAVDVVQVSGAWTFQPNAAKAASAAQVDADQVAEAIALHQVGLSRMCGQTVLDYISVINATKGITVQQTRDIFALFTDITVELKNGALDTARDSISNADLSSVILDESDRTKIIAKLDSCKP